MADDDKINNVDGPKRLPGMIRLQGINWPWMVTQESLEAMKNYDILDDDVWVNTYPKSGTHWTMEIVNLILADGHEDRINRQQCGINAECDYTPTGMEFSSKRPPRALPQYKEMLSWKPPRVVMTHLPEETMPTQMYQGNGKVIYVIRNPKDIAVSKWHFIVPWHFDDRFQDWNYFFEQYLAGESIFGSWFDHVLNFWNKHRYDKNFLFLTFEEMKRDTRGAIIQIADFLGKPLSENAIDRVLNFSSIESMKKRYYSAQPQPCSCNAETGSKESQVSDGSAPSAAASGSTPSSSQLGAPSMIRKGIVGDWKTQFTVNQNEAFDKVFQEKMAESGLKIQFE